MVDVVAEVGANSRPVNTYNSIFKLSVINEASAVGKWDMFSKKTLSVLHRCRRVFPKTFLK